MKTNFEFQSTAFPPYQTGEDAVQEGLYGCRLAEFVAEQLTKRGYKVIGIYPEDWGWAVGLHNDAFPLWVGCASYPDEPGWFRCFIEPGTPFVRRWFRKTPTRHIVEPLGIALEEILLPKVTDLKCF